MTGLVVGKPCAEAPARPIHTPLRARALAEPALQGTVKYGLMLLMLTLFLPSVVAAQTPRSQRGSVTQRVGSTEISITYHRPVARGRNLFGGGNVVHWGRIWHPGADSATTISLNRAITIEGNTLSAGRYSIWAIPQEPPKPWTLIFSRGVDIWHVPYPGESQDALRFTITPETGAHMETLAYYFPMVDADSAILRLHWGTTIIPLKIKATQD